MRSRFLGLALAAAAMMSAQGAESTTEAPVVHRGYRQGRRSLAPRQVQHLQGEKLAKKAAEGRVGITHATRGLLPAIRSRYPFSAKRGA